MNKTAKILLASAVMVLGASKANAFTVDLSYPYFTYGNTNSYSMPVSAYYYDQAYGGGVGPGNPYYIASGPGQIMNGVVIYTGSGGQNVTTNSSGFDNSYLTPNGSSPAYADFAGNWAVQPDATGKNITNNGSTTWDANLSTLKTFLNGGTALFLFNNNDTNSDQNLAIWAKLWITDASNDLYGRYLYLTNGGAIYGMGGSLNGDAKTYVGSNDPNYSPKTGYASTDYVLSGGQLVANGQTFNHNLGANQVAYAADLPLLNDWLKTLFGLSDDLLSDYTMHLDVRLGCSDPQSWTRQELNKQGDLVTTSCNDVKIDNGYEQLFLVANDWSNRVPEPATLMLLGISLVGLYASRRRNTI